MSEVESAHHERRKLDRAFVGGVAWTAGAKWLSQLVSWPAVIICARLLSPADFGVVEMAGFFFIITGIVAEFGIGMAVLQMQELDNAILAQLNTVSLMTGFLSFSLSVAAAPLIASFFRAPELQRLVIVSGLAFILISFEAIPLGLLQRDMDYRRLSIAESVQAITVSLVSVSCAYSGLAYWALVLGNLVGRAVNIGMIIYWRPTRFAIPHWEQVTTPLKFGMEVAMQRVVGTIGNLSDSMVIGRTLGQSLLGTYRMASNLASTPSEKIGTLIMRVTGPLFARVQDDHELLRRYFLIFTESLAMSIFPLLFGLAMVSSEAIRLILGPQWESAASPLCWLAIYMAVRTMLYLANQLLMTLRFTRFGMLMSFLNFAAMPVAFYVASGWGIGAVAASWLIMSPLSFVPIGAKILRAVDCSLAQYMKSLIPTLLASGAMLLAVSGLRMWLIPLHWPVLAQLTLEVSVGGIVYVSFLWAFYRARIMQYIQFFVQLRDSRRAASVAQ